ncbi:MAG: ribokinase [Micavibrio aeruginosavorus]|uniref:Ribokinase n=1 Tax=Micavibrio aeruginosavorus TaxID=349221 RepID=A0A2W5HIC9_9BACT|nr:MAG: ribokinase [Micavibrio aeruginosavorus]
MIIVFGSLNMDMSVRLEKLPQAGETILSSDYDLNPGGKGGNQALAAARAGAKVAVVGKVGDDNYGRSISEALRRDGVIVSGIAKSDDLPTGTALTARDAMGQKQIIILSGANTQAAADQIPDEILVPGNILLMQMELPVDETLSVLERAKQRGCTTILNMAPALSIPKRAMGNLDYLIVNSIEVKQIAQKLGMSGDNNALKIAHGLATEGQLTCLVTLGKSGAVAVTKDNQAWGVPTLDVDQSLVVDVNGAGDAYCGTFAAAIHDRLPLPEAMRRATVAATLCCMKQGAMPSLPYLDDIEAKLPELPQAQSVQI